MVVGKKKQNEERSDAAGAVQRKSERERERGEGERREEIEALAIIFAFAHAHRLLTLCNFSNRELNLYHYGSDGLLVSCSRFTTPKLAPVAPAVLCSLV